MFCVYTFPMMRQKIEYFKSRSLICTITLISLTTVFVSGCLSDELYATSSELVNHVPMTECNVLESEKSADMEIKDLNTNNSTDETYSCSTEDNTQLSDLGTKEETENSNLNLSSNPKSETVQDLSESISHGDHKSSKTYEQQGARPKVVDRSKNRQGTSNVHLSNKKRKELAKQEKKKQRDERRKEDSIPCLDSGAAGEQNTSNGIVTDLGLLAI